MKNFLAWFFAIIAFVVNTVVVLAFLNAKFDFLPESIDSKLDFVYERLSGEKESDSVNNTENINAYEEENDMVRLSTLITSPALEKLDVWVPSNTYIPTSEEIAKLYTVTEGAVIAAHKNADQTYTNIIVNDHHATIETADALITARDQVATQLQASYPNILLESGNSVEWKEDITIPVIEMYAEDDDISAYSCIAFFDVNRTLFTVTINHYGGTDPEVCDSAFDMFNQTLSNITYE
jgi:hypothetical protein